MILKFNVDLLISKNFRNWIRFLFLSAAAVTTVTICCIHVCIVYYSLLRLFCADQISRSWPVWLRQHEIYIQYIYVIIVVVGNEHWVGIIIYKTRCLSAGLHHSSSELSTDQKWATKLNYKKRWAHQKKFHSIKVFFSFDTSFSIKTKTKWFFIEIFH